MGGHRLAHDLKDVEPGNLIVASSPMRRCLLTIRPAVYGLKLAPGDCIVHGSCFEFGCAGLANKGTLAKQITADFPDFAPAGFNADGTWDYQGTNDKENGDEAKL